MGPQEATVIFCLLFDHEDQLIAAAPAVDVQHYGKRYWTDVYGMVTVPTRDWQVATLAINDLELVVLLQSLSVSDEHLAHCRIAIDRLLDETQGPAAIPAASHQLNPRAA